MNKNEKAVDILFYKKAIAIVLIILSVLLTGCTNSKHPDNTKQTTPPVTQPITEQVLSAKEKEFIHFFDKIRKEADFKGTVLVTAGDFIRYEKSTGFAVEETHNKIDTRYYIGSVTKQFTAAAILLLQERKLLTTEDTLDTYFPQYQYGHKIKIKHLLNMTSGLTDYLNPVDKEELGHRDTIMRLEKNGDGTDNTKMLADVILSSSLNFEPDSDFEYSNSGYLLLGLIIEQVSNMPYETFLKENLFVPLNMNKTSLTETQDTAKGMEGDTSKAWQLYPGVAFSAGGIISTVEDLHRWAKALTEGKVLSKASMDEMFASNQNHYGYGIAITSMGYAHTGSVGEFVSCIVFSKEGNYISIALSNYASTNSLVFSDEILELLAETSIFTPTQ